MLKEKNRTDLTSTVESFSHPAGTNINPPIGGYKNHSKISGLFQQLKSHFFNELVDDQSMSGETCSKIEHWLSQHSIDEL